MVLIGCEDVDVGHGGQGLQMKNVGLQQFVFAFIFVDQHKLNIN
jgi:hypothetical protein